MLEEGETKLHNPRQAPRSTSESPHTQGPRRTPQRWRIDAASRELGASLSPTGSFLQRKYARIYVRTGGGQSFVILPLCRNEPHVIGLAREEQFRDLDPLLGHPHRGAFYPHHVWQAGLRFPRRYRG